MAKNLMCYGVVYSAAFWGHNEVSTPKTTTTKYTYPQILPNFVIECTPGKFKFCPKISSLVTRGLTYHTT